MVGANAVRALSRTAHPAPGRAVVQSGTREASLSNLQWKSDDTDRHVVTLRGTVTSGAGRDRAEALAKRTGGVQRVVDQLTIIAN